MRGVRRRNPNLGFHRFRKGLAEVTQWAYFSSLLDQSTYHTGLNKKMIYKFFFQTQSFKKNVCSCFLNSFIFFLEKNNFKRLILKLIFFKFLKLKTKNISIFFWFSSFIFLLSIFFLDFYICFIF